MFKKLKNRISILKKSTPKTIIYIILCITTFICLIIIPFLLWMSSGALSRGVTSIRGNSMSPTIEDNQILYTKPVSYKRGEIVVVVCPYVEEYYASSGLTLLKRIVALPGEKITITEDGLLINGELLIEEYVDAQENTLQENNDINELILSDNEYFVLGDNRAESFDSRHVGAIEATEFLYALTTEPNEYTTKILIICIIVSVFNLCCIISSPYVWLLILTRNSIPSKRKKTKK